MIYTMYRATRFYLAKLQNKFPRWKYDENTRIDQIGEKMGEQKTFLLANLAAAMIAPSRSYYSTSGTGTRYWVRK